MRPTNYGPATGRFTSGDPRTPGPGDLLKDELGRREAVIEYAGGMVAAARSTTYAFDPITGGLATETTPEGTIHREYDPATGRLTRTYTADNDTGYLHNDLGQLWKVTATKLNGQTANLVTEHTYTATGALDTTRHHNDPGSTADDVAWDYAYDQLNRLEVLNVSNGAGFHLLQQEITYESDGQRDQMLETRYGGDSATPFSTTRIDWAYDAIGRLTQEHRDEGDDGLGIDGLPDAGDYIHTYAHDLSGNRLEKAEDVGADGAATPDVATAYTYNERNQLAADGPDANADGVPDAATDTTYAYDRAGNTTSVTTPGGIKLYVWDLRGRMTGYDANGDGDTADMGDITYAYDHDGLRVSKAIVGGTAAHLLLDKANPTGYAQVLQVSATAGGAPTRSFVIGHDVIAQADGSTVRHMLYDGGGHNLALINDVGQIAGDQVFVYDAFGNLIDQPATLETPLLYRGEWWDSDLGQQYLRSRWYIPGTGAFFSQDSYLPGAGDLGNTNLYLYSSANPINYIDPAGMSAMAVGLLNFGASFMRFVVDPGRQFTTSWGLGRELMGGLDFGTADAFELAELHQLSHEMQLMDIQAEVRRGMAQLVQSQQAMWEVWWSAYDDFPLLGDPIDMLLGFIGAQACFLAGTQVIVGVNEDGTYITHNIEDLGEGDLVLARDQHDAGDDAELRPVAQLFRKVSDHVRVVTVRDSNGKRK